jgi:hypothetical protein
LPSALCMFGLMICLVKMQGWTQLLSHLKNLIWECLNLKALSYTCFLLCHSQHGLLRNLIWNACRWVSGRLVKFATSFGKAKGLFFIGLSLWHIVITTSLGCKLMVDVIYILWFSSSTVSCFAKLVLLNHMIKISKLLLF